MRRTTLLHNLMPADSLSLPTDSKKDITMPGAFAVFTAQETQKDHGTDEETRVVSHFNFYGFIQWGSSARNLVYLQGGDAVLVLHP